ncbi:MAG: hypothetical protein AB7V18_20500, partial [Pyrinomonadaceae bacterium]
VLDLVAVLLFISNLSFCRESLLNIFCTSSADSGGDGVTGHSCLGVLSGPGMVAVVDASNLKTLLSAGSFVRYLRRFFPSSSYGGFGVFKPDARFGQLMSH